MIVQPTGHRVTWLFHATAIVRDYADARDRLAHLFGCRVLEDTRLMHPNIGRRGGLTWIGDNALEIGEPIVTGGAADRFLTHFGPGMHSIAVEVANLEATIAHLQRAGVRIAAQPSHSFVFTDPRDTDGILLQWWSGRNPLLPRFGGTVPAPNVKPVVMVESVAFIAALATRPVETAHRLAQMLGTPVTFERMAGTPRKPAAGVSLVNTTLALYPLTDARFDLLGVERARPCVHALGLEVANLAEAVTRLGRIGIEPLWSDGDLVALPPTATGDVPVLLSAGLLPSDPRAHGHNADSLRTAAG